VSVVTAAALDLALREPPTRVHPVVWAGSYLSLAQRWVPVAPPGRSVVAGATAWLGGALVAAAAGHGLEKVAGRVGHPWKAAIRGLALWPLLSARLLLEEVHAVEPALQHSVVAGRAALARIVSRDTTDLAPAEVRGAAIESLAENLSDSLVAPLTWFLLAGLPGAAVYRFVNTADACWGYRDVRWRHAGRAAAHADDAVNLLPARLTAALLYGGADWPRLRREASKTPSPNAGWPMAALALRLDVRLTKRGQYDLNPTGAEPRPGDLAAAVRTARRTTFVAVILAAALDHLLSRHRGERR